jgi:hypothetical protein
MKRDNKSHRRIARGHLSLSGTIMFRHKNERRLRTRAAVASSWRKDS